MSCHVDVLHIILNDAMFHSLDDIIVTYMYIHLMYFMTSLLHHYDYLLSTTEVFLELSSRGPPPPPHTLPPSPPPPSPSPP